MHRVNKVVGHITANPSSKRPVKRLSGKAAVVTGAASGIGRATAIVFAREGAAVVCTDVSKAVHETVKQIQSEGGKAVALQGDSSSAEFNRACVDECLAKFGDIHIFFANAGVTGQGKNFRELTVQDFSSVLDVNLLGVFLGWKYAALAMESRKHGATRSLCYRLSVERFPGGSLIATSSMAGLRCCGTPAPYSVSKAAVVNLAQTMSYELAGTGIRANVLCPGWIETGMTKGLFEGDKKFAKRVPLLMPARRSGQSEEIAEAALFLASDESSYVNGQNLNVCGGLSAMMPMPFQQG